MLLVFVVFVAAVCLLGSLLLRVCILPLLMRAAFVRSLLCLSIFCVFANVGRAFAGV